MNKDISIKWHFRHSPETVWAYLTEPELLSQWFMENNFQLVTGQQFQVTYRKKDGTIGEIIDCKLVEFESQRRLVWTWAARSNESKNTRVTWTLKPSGDGTDVFLLHNGFINEKDFVSHQEGWPTFEPRLAGALDKVIQ
jgi:uncharacterized protein YndB with AHSA1/START domain